MTEQEQQDLTKLHTATAEKLKSMFSSMIHLARLAPAELQTRGYKTNEEAVFGTFKHYQKEVDALTKAHLKKYPD